ncbi:MAG TPA: DUF2723 domain-containing protein, partial [Paenisporosarcina sp.]|nr:DUF2723 domain-containing protein [Paenisporosarcina sp.]
MILRLSWRQTEYILAFVSAIIPFLFYYLTLCPTVNFIDSGELATVASTLGIAHPTGYPLFTLLGWIFVHLPIGLRPIYQLNLMSAIFCTIGLFFFFRLLVLILNVFVNDKQQIHHHDKSQVERRSYFSTFIPAVTGTLILGLSEAYWSTALSVEVYSLHVILIALVLFLFLRAITYEYHLNDNNRKTGNLYWLGFAYILGLSFSNHMTTVLVGLAFLYLFFTSIYQNYSQESVVFTSRLYETFNIGIKKIVSLFPWFLMGLSVYLYLPIRASEGPLLNWGNPIDFEKIIWHITAKQYRVWMFTSIENAIKQLEYFITSLPQVFTVYPLILVVFGIWHLFRRCSFLFFTLLLFFGCILYSINYDIHDIDSYFLLAYFTIAIWSAVGVSVVIDFFKNHSWISIIGILLICLCSLLVINSFDRVNENQNNVVEQYAKDMLKSIEPNGIIISYQWDYFVSAA